MSCTLEYDNGTELDMPASAVYQALHAPLCYCLTLSFPVVLSPSTTTAIVIIVNEDRKKVFITANFNL